MSALPTLIIRLRGGDDNDDDVLDIVADESGRLAQAVTTLDDSYPYLSCIDQYGITIFNRLQARVLLSEIDCARNDSQFASLAGILDRFAAMAERCAEEVHLFLEVEGD